MAVNVSDPGSGYGQDVKTLEEMLRKAERPESVPETTGDDTAARQPSYDWRRDLPSNQISSDDDDKSGEGGDLGPETAGPGPKPL
jgi:hypothetical protein